MAGQDSLKVMQEDLSTVKDVQAQLLSTVTTMGSNVDMLLHADQPVSPEAADEKVADSVSSRVGARELPPLVEEDMEDEDEARGLLSSEDNKTTTVKTHPAGIGGPAISGGHRSVSPPSVPLSVHWGSPVCLEPLNQLARDFWVTDQTHHNQASVEEQQQGNCALDNSKWICLQCSAPADNRMPKVGCRKWSAISN